jgi:hypothetical protein
MSRQQDDSLSMRSELSSDRSVLGVRMAEVKGTYALRLVARTSAQWVAGTLRSYRKDQARKRSAKNPGHRETALRPLTPEAAYPNSKAQEPDGIAHNLHGQPGIVVFDERAASDKNCSGKNDYGGAERFHVRNGAGPQCDATERPCKTKPRPAFTGWGLRWQVDRPLSHPGAVSTLPSATTRVRRWRFLFDTQRVGGDHMRETVRGEDLQHARHRGGELVIGLCQAFRIRN